MTKKLLSNKFVWLLLAVIIFLFPITIDQAPQTQYRSVAIGVGIDKQGSEYLFSTQILEPKNSQGFTENLQVYSASGKNCLEAMQKLTTDLGKIAGLSNTSVIVFSKQVAREGVISILDFFVRSTRLNDNPIVVVTQKSAKQLLLDVSKIDNSFSLSLNSLSKYNAIEVNSQFATMENLLSNYYSGTIATLLAEINERENSDEGLEIENELSNSSKGGSDGQGGESGGGQSSNTSGKTIENSGETALFVADKQVATLSADEIKGFNACLGANRGVYTLENITDENLQNANIVLTVKQKRNLVEYGFSKSGNPRVTYHMRYEVKIENIIQENMATNLLDNKNSFLTKTVADKFKSQVLSDVARSLQIAREYNADAFGVQDGFSKYRPKKWKEYLKSLKDKTKAFEKIDFFVEIQVKAMT